MFKKNLIPVFLTIFLFTSCKNVPEKHSSDVSSPSRIKMAKRTIIIKGNELDVDIAATIEEKTHGLMGREKLGRNEGMLFVYHKSTIPKFWMKNTSIPLSVAFIDSHKRIIQIEKLEPFSLEKVSPDKPIRFAIEANQGWFEKNGIMPGHVFWFKTTGKQP